MEKERRIKTLAIVSVIVAILGLTISFAALSKTLKISSNAMVSPVNWQLKFSNLSDANITGNATLNEVAKIDTEKPVTINGINICFKTPGDKVIYKVDLVNEGTIDARIDEVISTISSSLIDFTVNYTDSKNTVSKGDIIKSGEVKNLTLTLYYNKENITKETLPNEDINISLSYELVFVQSDSKTTTSKAQTLNCTEFTKKDTYGVGDVISFCNTSTGKSEDFYVVEDKGDSVVALAKYNLLIGDEVTYNEDFSNVLSRSEISKDDSEYGLQSEKTTMKFNEEDGIFESTVRYGTVAFANKDETHKGTDVYYGYWLDSSGKLLSNYGTSYPVDVFDSNSLLYSPLNNYFNYLKNTLNKKGVTGTILSYNYLMDVYSKVQDSGNDDSFLMSTYYWTSSASRNDAIWSMLMITGLVRDVSFYRDDIIGLRPAITISKSEI